MALDSNTPQYHWHLKADPQYGWWTYLTLTHNHRTWRLLNSERWRPTKQWAAHNGRKRAHNHNRHHPTNPPTNYNKHTQEPR